MAISPPFAIFILKNGTRLYPPYTFAPFTSFSCGAPQNPRPHPLTSLLRWPNINFFSSSGVSLGRPPCAVRIIDRVLVADLMGNRSRGHGTDVCGTGQGYRRVKQRAFHYVRSFRLCIGSGMKSQAASCEATRAFSQPNRHYVLARLPAWPAFAAAVFTRASNTVRIIWRATAGHNRMPANPPARPM